MKIELAEVARQVRDAELVHAPFTGTFAEVALPEGVSFANATEEAMQSVQRKLVAGRKASAERPGADADRLQEASDDAQNAAKDFQDELQRMTRDTESDLNTTNMWMQAAGQLGQTLQDGQARIQAARRGIAYTPPPMDPSLVESQRAMQDAIGQAIGTVNAAGADTGNILNK